MQARLRLVATPSETSRDSITFVSQDVHWLHFIDALLSFSICHFLYTSIDYFSFLACLI
jgi:hypothetical protein